MGKLLDKSYRDTAEKTHHLQYNVFICIIQVHVLVLELYLVAVPLTMHHTVMLEAAGAIPCVYQ